MCTFLNFNLVYSVIDELIGLTKLQMKSWIYILMGATLLRFFENPASTRPSEGKMACNRANFENILFFKC